MAFAGLDVGTSGSKLVVYRLDGRVLFQASRAYREQGEGGRRELSPSLVMEKVKEILSEAGENCPEPVEALAVASLGESVVCLDAQGAVLADSMLTGDERGIRELKEIEEAVGAEHIFQLTGLPPNELYGLPKYRWLNRNTEAVKKAAAIFFYEDLISFMLTGERKVSWSSAARSLAFDMYQKEWSEELLGLAGIRKEQMSEPVKPLTVIGKISREMARELKLNPDMKVVAGGHDQTCAALGSGLMDQKTGECGMGTCEFLFAMLPEAKRTPYMRAHDFTCIPYVFPDTYLTSLEVTTCGALKNWARDTIFCGAEEFLKAGRTGFYQAMDQAAARVQTDVMVLPQFGSSGNPRLSMDARGTIAGLTVRTRPEEIYRAMVEGMAFQMYLAYEKLKPLGVSLEAMAATGGGAASELALQIRADIFGIPVFSLEQREAGTMGCMLMAAAALGAYPSLEEGMRQAIRAEKEFTPDPASHSYYQERFCKYRALYEKMYDF